MIVEEGFTPEDGKRAVQEAEILLAESIMANVRREQSQPAINEPPTYKPRSIYQTAGEIRGNLILGTTFVLGCGIAVAGYVLDIEASKAAGIIIGLVAFLTSITREQY